MGMGGVRPGAGPPHRGWGAVTGVYFVALGGDEHYDEAVAAGRRQVERVQLEPLQPGCPVGAVR
jgi:hypothetical protein